MTTATAAAPADDVERLVSLLGDVARGRSEALEGLYRATSSKLFGICLHVLRDRGEAEDTLQEVYVAVWQKAAQFDAAIASPVTWLAAIARNKSIDRRRSAAQTLRNASVEIDAELRDEAPAGLEFTEAALEGRRLSSCMDELQADRRVLVQTAFFDGITYEELATRTGNPLGTVKSWIRRSLQALKACLER